MTGRIYPKLQPECVDESRPPSPHCVFAPSDSCQETVEQVRHRVKQAVSRGDFLRAIALLNRLIMNDPTSAEDLNNRGLIHFWQGSGARALSDFNRAIAIDPELSAAYNNRGNYYAAQGRPQRALEDYESAIDRDPFYVRARINQAMTLRELGQYDEALVGFEEALLFRQFDSEIYAERGRTYHLRGDWNCAIADYYRALEALPSYRLSLPPSAQTRRTKVMSWLTELHPAA